MRFCSIASGSSGNCIYVGTQETHLLIDAGISGKRIEKGLNELDLTGKDIDGILITHEHSDHIGRPWRDFQENTRFPFTQQEVLQMPSAGRKGLASCPRD